MKLRQGFVSNSSSSSFTILKRGLSGGQKEIIKNHIAVAKAIDWENEGTNICDYDRWSIEDLKDKFFVSTDMTNFDLHSFLIYMGIPLKNLSEQDD